MILYTQGLSTLIAAGIVTEDRATLRRMLHGTGMVHLRGLGVPEETIAQLLPPRGADDPL